MAKVDQGHVILGLYIDLCITLAVFQLYRDVNKFYIINSILRKRTKSYLKQMSIL